MADKRKCDIGDAMVLLYEEYKRAKEIEWVNKPISYALYHTWKHFDCIEKSRNDWKDLKEQKK